MEEVVPLYEMVRRARVKRGLSQRSFARLMKICPSGICRFEKGERSLEQKALLRICDYLGIEYGAEIKETKNFGKKEVILVKLVMKKEQAITCPRCLHRHKVVV